MSVLDLTGLPIDTAVALVQRMLDHWFEIELVAQKAAMIRDGLYDVEGRLDCQIKYYLADRAEYLDELRDWLIDCNRKLH